MVIVCDLLSTFLRFRRFLAIDIVGLGYGLTVICSESDVEDLSFFEDNDIDVLVVPMNRTGMNPVSDFGYCRRLKKALKEINPRHVLAYQAKAAVWSAVATRSLSNCKSSLLFPGLGFLFAESDNLSQRLIKSVVRKLYKFAFRNIDTAVFQNSDDQETLNRFAIIPAKAKQVVVNGSGVCLKEFPSSEPPSDPIVFSMATRLLSDKGIREFATAASEIRTRYPDTKVAFRIAGNFDINPTAIQQEEIEQWEEKGWIEYHGHVADMVSYLRDTSVFVLPSYYMEGTPRSILEALATGRAVITADNRGCRDTVEDGVNGYLVPQRDADALAVAMERYLTKPELLAAHGSESRKLAVSKYDVKLINQAMISAMNL